MAKDRNVTACTRIVVAREHRERKANCGEAMAISVHQDQPGQKKTGSDDFGKVPGKSKYKSWIQREYKPSEPPAHRGMGQNSTEPADRTESQIVERNERHRNKRRISRGENP